MRLRNQKGMALVITFIAILSVALMAATFAFIIVNQLNSVRKDKDTTSALFIAKAGANKAVRQLEKDISDTASITGSLLDGTYAVTIDGTNQLITSIGTVHGRTQKVIIAYGSASSAGGPGTYFDYGVFTDDEQDYKGGGNPHDPIVDGASVHSNHNTPSVNNPSHDIVDDPPYEVEGPDDKGFPTLNIRYDATNSNYNYYNAGSVETLNDYWHIATAGGKTNGDTNNHYYHDFTDTKLPSAYQISNITTSPTMPTSNGATLIISTSASPPTVSIGDGSGTLIIIGANAEIPTGNTTFTGLIFVMQNKNSVGGAVTIHGNAKIYGSLVCKSLDVAAGTPRVYYDSSYFNDDNAKAGDKTASLIILSWQAEY